MNDTTIGRRAALAMTATGLTLGAFGLSRSAQAAGVRGGKLIFARHEDCKILDPATAELNADIWVMTNLLGMLLEPSADGKGLEPGLATKWTWSNGGKTLTLDLRPGVKFADGAPFSAEDVKFTLDRLTALKDGPWSALPESIEATEVAGPLTAVLKLKHPDPALLAVLGMFTTSILPKAYVSALPGATLEDKVKAFADKPIGTGPFVMTEWQRDTVMRVKRNPYFWKMAADGKPLPWVDEIEFPILHDDATRLLKLKAGEISGTELIPYARVAELKADPNLRVELWPSTKTVIYILNQRPTLKDGTKNPLADVRVRQALNYAVNKEAIIQITTLGLGKPMKTFLSSATPLAIDGPPLYPYDLAKAKALMKEAGYEKGFELTVLSLAGSQDETTNATALQQMWSQLGVKLKIEQIDMASRLGRFKGNDFQLRGFYWTDDLADPSEATSSYVYSDTNQALHSGWVDAKANALFMASQQEPDPEKRAAQYKELQNIYNSIAPIIYLYEVPYPVAFRTNVKGFVQLPLGNNIFEGAYIEKG